MAYSFAFDRKSKVLLARFEGRVTDDGMVDFYGVAKRLIARAPEFRGTIVDFSPVAEFEVSPETIRQVAWAPPIDSETSRPTVIVAPSPPAFDVMWILATQGQETRPNLHLVKNMEHAHAILGMADATFERLDGSGWPAH